MTFSSWTYDQKGIDYLPYSETIGTSNFLENEGWYLFKTSGISLSNINLINYFLVKREEVKYSCKFEYCDKIFYFTF